jgi:ubiquinone/menaquinone biosynthesis C-methylase UbiE
VKKHRNIDKTVVSDFGKEWSRFDQSDVPKTELHDIFQQYFTAFPFENLPENAQGFDLGCGSGRWAAFIAPRVGTLYCLDPSSAALAVAKKNLAEFNNCIFYIAGVDDIPIDNNTMDFGYSLGVLHHVPDTQDGLSKCVEKLKPGAPFLLYLYYAFDNKPCWFKAVWKLSDILRRGVSVLPYPLKYMASQIIAFLVYFPLSRLARLIEKTGVNVNNFPLSAYRNRSVYTLRTDALDRFGTRLEQRFTRKQIEAIMTAAGLEKICFNETGPYWVAVGYKTGSMHTD